MITGKYRIYISDGTASPSTWHMAGAPVSAKEARGVWDAPPRPGSWPGTWCPLWVLVAVIRESGFPCQLVLSSLVWAQ